MGSLVQRWDSEACGRVHRATLTLLADTGVDVLDDEGRALLASAGADVQGTRVRLSSEIVEGALALAPRSFTLRDRGGRSALELRSGNVYFGTGSDCLYYCDPDDGERRRVRNADVQQMAAVCEHLPNMDFVMSMGLPEDVPQAVDDLAPFAAMLAGTHKPLLVAPREASFLPVMQEMAGLCGESRSFGVYSMPAPPLRHSSVAVEKLIICARLGIPLVYGPAGAAGATAPCSLAGVALLSNAEVLSGLVIAQLANNGAPFIYGANAYGVDMRSGTATYCAPESFAGQFLGCDMARFYGLPSFGYSGVSDAKLQDEQCSLEMALTLILGALAGATLLHDVGYLEAGLQSSCETIVLGDELVGFARAVMRDVSSDEEELAMALAELAAVGPGGDFLGRRLTRDRAHDWWHPTLLDQMAHDRWQAQGEKTLGTRVKTRVAELRTLPASVLDEALITKLMGMVESHTPSSL